MDSLWTSFANELVQKPNVGKSSTGHNFVMPTPGTVRVEIFRGDSTTGKPTSSGGASRDITGRGNVIGGDRVPHIEQCVRILNMSSNRKVLGDFVKERCTFDIG
eukprot:Pompholyxophrys_punicea_v1_NODE_1681_length_594_cov_1.424861.p2 type:complete len:104 gc:universal NODE_1681_length_594_cov_1.424861:360-49(-)